MPTPRAPESPTVDIRDHRGRPLAFAEDRAGSGHLGVAPLIDLPFRVYLLDDLRQTGFPARRALLQAKVCTNDRVMVWGPGSGMAEGADATGFEFDRLPVNYPRRVLVSNFTHPITQGLPADAIIGSPLAYGPVLLPQINIDGSLLEGGAPPSRGPAVGPDGPARLAGPLALQPAIRLGEAWTKAARVAAGLAVQDMDGWHSVFTTAVPLPAGLWRGLARFAGAHVYCEENDVVLADAGLVALHTVKSGRKTIHLPQPVAVVDVISGRRVSDRASTIEFDAAAPATHVFRLE
jgi:hypothetical protein